MHISRTGEKQPDNWEGITNGKIETEFDVGITIEGWQEYHDEACLNVQNGKYNDGVTWHDVACHTRSVIVCEDSDQLLDFVRASLRAKGSELEIPDPPEELEVDP